MFCELWIPLHVPLRIIWNIFLRFVYEALHENIINIFKKMKLGLYSPEISLKIPYSCTLQIFIMEAQMCFILIAAVYTTGKYIMFSCFPVDLGCCWFFTSEKKCFTFSCTISNSESIFIEQIHRESVAESGSKACVVYMLIR